MAKTLVTAVDAATAANPADKAGAGRVSVTRSAEGVKAAGRSVGEPGRAPAGQVVGKTVVQAREVHRGVRRGARQFGQAFWARFARLSGVLWLEVTGVFFGLFALFAVGAIWRLRGAWHSTAANEGSHKSLLGAMAMLGVFGYFCVSSFVRARRRERGGKTVVSD